METNLVTHLETLTGLQAHPHKRPPDSSSCLVYLLVSETRDYMIDQTWQIDTWSKSLSEARDVSKQIANSFESFIGDLSGVPIQFGTVLNRRETYHSKGDLYQISLDINLKHHNRS